MTVLPAGFASHVANLGIKDTTDDFVVIASADRCAAAGVFTRSRFAGPSVTISRANVADGGARAVVVIAKNANVATGAAGASDAREITERVAGRLGCGSSDVLLASTGVIGHRYPMQRIRDGIDAMVLPLSERSADAAAGAIMTTDTVEKVEHRRVGGSVASVVGIAKGVGMMEPDMATLIAVVLTDAEIQPRPLRAMFRRVVDRTFNCVSIDTDTSTSDTAVLLASGHAGPVDAEALEAALHGVCLGLTKRIAADGEGAQTVIEVLVDRARDGDQARRVAKSIVNSPLVKTAVHGADPNWGRVAMAIGKCSDDTDIHPERVVIRFGEHAVYPVPPAGARLAELSRYLAGDEVLIHVSLGIDDGAATVWGCDLTESYIRINADYTT